MNKKEIIEGLKELLKVTVTHDKAHMIISEAIRELHYQESDEFTFKQGQLEGYLFAIDEFVNELKNVDYLDDEDYQVGGNEAVLIDTIEYVAEQLKENFQL